MPRKQATVPPGTPVPKSPPAVPNRRGPGRPRRVITAEQRQEIETLVGYGFCIEAISRLVGIPHTTLNDRCREELNRGADSANSQVINALYQKALTGDVGAIVWWTKNRMGWSDKQRTEISGPEGKPIQIEDVRHMLADKIARLVGGATGSAKKGPGSEPAA